MRLRLPTINHRLPTCQPMARVCGLLDRVGGALAEERERLELKAIEMLKGPKRLVQPEPVNHAWWDDGSGDMLFIRYAWVDAFEKWANA